MYQFIRLHGLVRRNVIRFLSGICAPKMIECRNFVFSSVVLCSFFLWYEDFLRSFFSYACNFCEIFWLFFFVEVFSLLSSMIFSSIQGSKGEICFAFNIVPIWEGRVTIFSVHVLLVFTENASYLKMLIRK